MQSVYSRFLLIGLGILTMLPNTLYGQNISSDLRGDEDLIARGIMDGNLIETNFRMPHPRRPTP